MSEYRFVVALGASTSRYHRAARPLRARTLLEAERWAQEWLEYRRASRFGGVIWDRWSIAHVPDGQTLPKIVAHGDETGMVSSARDHGWVD
jgi:hypothetical protein